MCKLRDEAMARAGEMPITGRRMDDHAAPAQPLQWPAPDAEGLWQDAGFLDLLGGYAIARAAGGMPVFDALGALKDYTIRYFAGEEPCAPAPPEFRVIENLSGAAVRGECTAPPPGWYCTRTAGHVGRYAAHRAAAPAVPATGSIGDDAQFRILTRAWREAAPLPSGALAWADLVAHVDNRFAVAANAGRNEGLQEAQQVCRSQADGTSGAYQDGCVACANILGDLRASTVDAAAESQTASVAARDVLAERRRQVKVKGWAPQTDDGYAFGELAQAAICYIRASSLAGRHDLHENVWPWTLNWWKPTTNRRNLVKAGALIVAEIERIDRAADKARAA